MRKCIWIFKNVYMCTIIRLKEKRPWVWNSMINWKIRYEDVREELCNHIIFLKSKNIIINHKIAIFQLS